MKLVILGGEREVSSSLTAETGALVCVPFSPPVNIGESFGAIAPINVAAYASVDARAPTHIARPELPTQEQVEARLRADPGTRLVNGWLCWEHGGRSLAIVLQLLDDDGQTRMAAYFDGSILRFRVGAREASLDCGWACEQFGVAIFRWSRSEVSITYNLTHPDGYSESRRAVDSGQSVDATPHATPASYEFGLDAEQLFIETGAELGSRMNAGNTYDLIRCAGIMRLWLLDREPLLHKLNRAYKVSFTFRTIALPAIDWKLIAGGEPHLEYLPGQQWEGELPPQFRRQDLNWDQFLAVPVLRTGGTTFTAREIIKFVAHVRGGVHFFPPEPKEKLLEDVAETMRASGLTAVNAVEPAVHVMQGLAKVVLEAAVPLRDAVKAKRGWR